MKVLELFFLKICLLSALGLCEKLVLRFHFFTYAKFMIKDKKGRTSNYSVIFFCVAKGESRSRSAVTPSVRPSVCPSVLPKILSSQLLRNYWSNYHETWYVDRTSYVVMHIGRKFWSPHFCGSYAPWNLENTPKWRCHRNSSETTNPIFMKLGM